MFGNKQKCYIDTYFAGGLDVSTAMIFCSPPAPQHTNVWTVSSIMVWHVGVIVCK